MQEFSFEPPDTLNEALAARVKDISNLVEEREHKLIPMGRVKDLVRRCTRFHTLANYRDVAYVCGWQLHAGNLSYRLLLLLLSYGDPAHVDKYATAPRTVEDLQALLLYRGQRSPGAVLIRPETMADKITEWFQPQELDFKEHPGFSRRYYLLAEEEAMARAFFNQEILEALYQQPGLLLEWSSNSVLIRFPQQADRKNVKELITFADRFLPRIR